MRSMVRPPPPPPTRTHHQHRPDVTARSCPRSGGAEAEQDGCVLGSGELSAKGGKSLKLLFKKIDRGLREWRLLWK